MAESLVDSWKDINKPGSFSSARYFYKGLKTKRTEKEVKKELEKDIHYQTTRSLRRNFPRRRDFATYFSDKFESDIADIGANRFVDVKTGKEKGRFFIVFIDIFSKANFSRGLKDKSGKSVLQAFKSVEEELKSPYTTPLVLETDGGSEYFNKIFQNYLRENKVELVRARGVHKSRTAERLIRSFKKVLIPFLETNPNISWNDAIQEVSHALNRRFNRSIGMAPADVVNHWEEVQRKVLKENPIKPFSKYVKEQQDIQKGKSVKEKGRSFAIGDKVIIPFKKEVLDKESDRQFTYQVYTIRSIRTEQTPIMFGLVDGQGKTLKRLFYAQELRKVVEPDVYPVKSVLKTKKVRGRKYVLVSWLDHDKSYDEWVLASSLV